MQILGTLYKRYTEFVFLVSMKYVKNEEDAREVSALVFEKLISVLTEHDVEYFKSWLYSVTRNECMMIFRKQQTKRKRKKEYEKEAESFVEFEHESHLSGKQAKEEQLTELKKAMSQLNKEQKQSVDLFYLQQKSYAEICDITGYELKKVKSYIQNGKRNLKNMLSESGIFVFLLLIGL